MGMQTVQLKDGFRVINADKDFTLNITESDIVGGVAMDEERCAGAIACMREFPGAERASFKRSRSYILCKVGPTQEQVWLRYGTTNLLRTLEAINDVVAKDIEQAKRYAGPVVLKALPKSKRPNGKQQGSDQRPGKPKKRTVPMRG